jgi:hypothetical protein
MIKFWPKEETGMMAKAALDSTKAQRPSRQRSDDPDARLLRSASSTTARAHRELSIPTLTRSPELYFDINPCP